MKVDADGHQEEDVRRLREFSAFDKFSDSDLERLVGAAHHTSRSVPWPLIREKTSSDDCFILLSGEVGVYVGDDRVALLGPGEVIGESVLRRGKLRSATVTTTGPAEVLRIERDDLARLIDEIPALRETMDETVARHVSPDPPAKPKPERCKVNASVSADLVGRFEETATNAGVGLSSALEDALTQWIEARSTAKR
jgi:signal-transduction protein with cAMP-binding, CBS, and nucleotidyltransferase domain